MDVRLKDPKTDYVVVVGSPIEAANLRAAGYTDVDEESTDASARDGVAQTETDDASAAATTDASDPATQTGDAKATDAGAEPDAAGKAASSRRR